MSAPATSLRFEGEEDFESAESQGQLTGKTGRFNADEKKTAELRESRRQPTDADQVPLGVGALPEWMCKSLDAD